MFDKKITKINDFVNKYPITTNIIFSICTAAMLMITTSNNNHKILIIAYYFISLFSIIIIYTKYNIIQRISNNLTYKKLFYGIIAATIFSILATLEFYNIWFSALLNGDKVPYAMIKHIYERIHISKNILNLCIKTGCIFIGIISVISVTVIIISIWDFITFLSETNTLLLLNNDIIEVPQYKIKKYKLISFSLLILMGIVMFAFSSSQSFWGDELGWTIGRVANKKFSQITKQLLQDGYNMPLFYYVLAIIYPIVPYGEGYLLSINIVFTIFGIIILYFISKELKGETFALITICVASTSSVLMEQGGWECRPYAFYFCFSALTTFFYIIRLKKENWFNIILYGLAMVLLVYSHWFGAIMLIFYGLCDLYLLIKNKITIKCLVSYFILIILFLPWFILMVLNVNSDLKTYWADVPSFITIFDTIKWMLSQNLFFIIAFCLAFVIILYDLIKKDIWNSSSFIWKQTILTCIWMISLTFIYSRIINPNGSIFVNRYFFALVPQVLLIASFGIGCIIKSIKTTKFLKKTYICLILFFIIVIVMSQNYFTAISSITSKRQAFREYAEYISKNKDYYSNDSLIISYGSGRAWIEYYFKKRGFEIPSNLIDGVKNQKIIISNGIIQEENQIVSFDYIKKFKKVFYFRQTLITSTDQALTYFLNENFDKVDENDFFNMITYECKKSEFMR